MKENSSKGDIIIKEIEKTNKAQDGGHHVRYDC